MFFYLLNFLPLFLLAVGAQRRPRLQILSVKGSTWVRILCPLTRLAAGVATPSSSTCQPLSPKATSAHAGGHVVEAQAATFLEDSALKHLSSNVTTRAARPVNPLLFILRDLSDWNDSATRAKNADRFIARQQSISMFCTCDQ